MTDKYLDNRGDDGSMVRTGDLTGAAYLFSTTAGGA